MKKKYICLSILLFYVLSNIQIAVMAKTPAEILQNAVVIDTGSSAIIVNGAKRYISVDNPEEKPDLINGSVYLPVHTLSRALGYYYEAEPKKGYYLFRMEDTQIRVDGQYAYVENGTKLLKKMSNPIVYKNGKALVPVRKMSELVGKTVSYKDGMIVISDEETDINQLVQDYIETELGDFENVSQSGRTYYVAQNESANDSNDGSFDKPLRTLSRAGQLAGPGDTVFVREGVYRETFSPTNSGTATSPIVYQAYEDEEVVISATEIMTNFQSAGNGMVKKSILKDLGMGRNQLFYQGEALAEGRYPNGPLVGENEKGEVISPLFPVKGQFEISAQNQYQVESSNLLNQSAGWWNGAIYVGMQGAGWTLSTGRVKTSEPGKLTIYDTPKQWWFAKAENEKQSYGFLTGHINCVDLPGEWAVQNGELYIIPPKGETANSLRLEVKTRQLAVDLSDKSYIKLKGIDTFGGGVRMKDSIMCIIDGAEMKYISHYIHGRDQREGYIDDGNVVNENGAPPRGEMGIYVGGENNVIINSIIDHSAGAGIYSTGVYGYFENNVVRNCGYAGGYVSGITFGTEGWKTQSTPRAGFGLYHNTVYNCGRSALNMQGRQYWPEGSNTPYLPFEVAFNDFHDGILFSLDTGIVYEYFVHAGSDELNSKLHHNYVYYTQPQANPYGLGIYHDGNTSGIDTYENLVFTTEPDVKFSHGYIFKQPETNCNVWNNMEIRKAVEGGRGGLQVSDFPGGRPYFAGAYLQKQDYDAYCEKFMNKDVKMDFYAAKDADMGNASVGADGCVQISNGGWIRWDNVDFGEGANRININFKGNANTTKDRISVVIGDTTVSGESYNAVLVANAPGLSQNNIAVTQTKTFVGKQTVYLYMNRNMSARIDGITVSNRGAGVETHNGEMVYGGEYNNAEKIGNYALMPTPVYSVNGDTLHPMVRNTYGGTVLRYDNVQINNNASKLCIAASSSKDSSGGIIQIRIGSSTATPIASYTTKDTGWDSYSFETIDLGSVVKAGTYDVYVTFKETNKTCNFYAFGFLAE